MRRGKRKLAILLAVSLFAGILQPMPTTHATEDAIVVESTTETESVAESEEVVIVNEVVEESEEVIIVQTEEVTEQVSEETITEQITEVKTSEQDTQEVVTESTTLTEQTTENSVEDVTDENTTMQTAEDSVEDVTDENTTVQTTEEVTTEEVITEEETTEEETTIEEIVIMSLDEDVSEWNFSDKAFVNGEYSQMGEYTYNGLIITNGKSQNKKWLNSGKGTISVPVKGDCKIVVEATYMYSFYFENDTETSVNVRTGSTAQRDTYTYDYKGSVGLFNITVLGTSYINSIYILDTSMNEYVITEEGVLRTYIGNGGAIVIPDNVVEIADNAFYDRDDITSVQFPNSLTEIGTYAFYDCDGLTEIVIPDKVTSIGNSVFYDCNNISEIELSSSLISIGNSTFYNCDGLTEIVIPNKVTSIGNSTFYDCNNISKIELSSSLISIGNGTFYNCSSLSEIEIPEGVKSIGKAAFRNCSNLCKVELPSSLTSIESSAFASCYSLTKINILEGITSIGDYAFYYCEELTEIDIPKGIISIGDYAFSYCKGLTELIIPDEVTDIGYRAFEHCSSVKNLVLGKNVTNLGEEALRGMDSLEELTIPDNVDYYSFGREPVYSPDPEPKILHIRKSVEYISPNFYSVGSLEVIEVEEGNITYSSKDGVLYENVENGKKLLAYPRRKTGQSFELDLKIVEIASGAFNQNSYLKKVILPEGMTEIPYKLFYECGISEVVLPESLTTIGSYAFYGCGNLKKLIIPNGVTSIGSYAFQDCDGFDEIITVDELSSIDQDEDSNQLVLGNKITTIGKFAFCNCSGLTKVVIPDSVISIEACAFYDCEMVKEFIFGINVENIGNNAFYCVGSKQSDLSIIVPDNEVNINGELGFFGVHTLKLRSSTEKISSDFYNLYILEIDVENGNLKFNSENGVLYENTDDGKILVRYPRLKQGEEYEVDSETTEIGNFTFNDCAKLKKIIIPKEVTTIGTSAFSGIDKSNFVIYCYAGSQAQKYAIDNGFTYEFIEPHEHELEEEVIVKSTCTTAGKSHFQCKTCYYYEESVVEAIGHKVSETWICDVQATCSKEGKASHHCLNEGCDYTEGSKVIEILEHQYSDWEIEKQSTVTESGYQTRRCLNCGKEEKEEIPAIPLDGNTYSLYGRVSFRLVDKERNPINNGKVVFFDSEGESYVAKSNAQGQISTILAVGSYHVQAYMGNSMLRNVRITVMPGENKFADMILSDRAKITGSLSHHEMTLEEMLEAGIDVDALENNHVVRYEVKIGFVSDVTYPFIDFLFDFVDGVWVGNTNGNIPDGYKVTFHSGSDEDNNDNNNPADNHKDEVIQMNDRDSNKPYFRIENEEEVIRVYLLSEQFFLVVRGETKWLKEMFDVELFISNDMGEDIVDCQAELIIPEGLSLATMVDKDSNQQIQNISRIKDGKTSSVHWYVRGDMEGTYMLDARFTGVKESYGDAFEYLFTTAAPLVVYAGSALEMTLYLQPETKFNETFKMGIEVKNVSDRNLYNVTHSILSAEQGVNKTYKYCKYYEGAAYPFETWTEDQWVSLCKQEFGPEGNVSLDVMEPGDSLIVWAETTIVYQHTAETVVKDKLPTARDIVASIAEAVAEVEPGTIKGFIADFLSTQDVYFLVDSVSVTTEPGSTTTIPYKVKFLEYERKEPKLGRLAFEALLEKAPKHLKEWITGECIDFVAGDFSDLVDTGIQIKDAVEEYNTSVNEPENFDSENDGIAVSGSSTNAQFEVYTEIIDVSMQEEMTVMSARSTQQTSDLLYIEVENNDTVERHEDGRITFTGDANLKWVGLAEGSVAVTIKEVGTDSDTTVRVNVTENPIAYTDASGEYVYYSQGTTFKEKTVAQIEKYGFQIVDANEQKLIGNEIVATGMKIQKYREDELDNEVYAVVHGDVDGDGDSNIFDMMEVSEHLLDEDVLSGAYLMAAKSYDNDTDDITIFDLNALSEELLVANE